MGDKSWEDMAREVLVDGRPADIASAALGWKELIKNVGEVKESLEKNVKDLGAVWKGPAYESFKTHIEGLAKQAGNIQDDVEKPGRGKSSMVEVLENAARDLEAAQNAMPVPAACVGDVLAARNGELILGVGMFETKVKADLLGSWPAEQMGKFADWVSGWFSDQEGEARKVYDTVNGQYKEHTMKAPGQGTANTPHDLKPEVPNLDTGGGDKGKVGSVPDIGGMPKTGGIGDTPTVKPGGLPETGNPGIGSGAHPDLSNNYPGVGSGGAGGGGGIPDGYGTGLAGAGAGTTTPGLGGSSGLGGGGLGSGGGLGGGAGSVPGGGALGKPVTPGMPPMMGGGMAGAGRGGGRGGSGRVGAGRPGAGMPGMGGMAGGGAAGRGAAGKGGAGARGVGARGAGVAGMGGGHGAGYGEEESARNTWLEEDEDVWGADGDGAPGILR